jgi:transcriptional regulator GlxA family with amidase domain
VELFRQIYVTWMNKQSGHSIRVKGLFLLILYRLFELLVFNIINDDTGDYRVKKTITYISKHFNEKLTVKKMAEMAGLSAAHFGELFKRETGLSMNHYLLQIRIKNAENMLVSGKYKVGDIAESCGFSDEIHFYKNFKALKGFPPSFYIPKKK